MKKLVGIFFILALLNAACNKNQNTRIDYNKGIDCSQNFVTSEQMIVQLLNTFFKSLTDSVLIANGQSKIDKADVLYSPPPEESITIKYPSWGIIDNYGHRRTNSYQAIPQTSFDDPNAEIDIVFQDFQYDFDTITSMNFVVRKQGKVDGVNDYFGVSADNIDRIYADTSGVMSFNLSQQFIRHKNPNTIYTSPDDYFLISGIMSGVTKDHHYFDSNMMNDSSLINSFSCNYLKSGPVKIEVTQFTYVSDVYFPEPDSCDNEYLIIINDNPFPYPID